MNNILINTPCLKSLGGVSNHYIGLKNKWTLNVIYNTIGSRKKIPFFILLPFDLVNFFLRCLLYRPYLIVLNPSLGINALRRDALFLFVAKALNIKTIVFFHGWDLEIQKKIDDGYYNIFKNYKKTDLFLVLASDFKEKLKNWGFKTRIELTTTKVDDDLIKSFSIEKKPQNKDILFLSRIEEDKGIFIVLKTFKNLKLKYPELKLTIAGDGSALIRAKEFVKTHNIKSVLFTGRVSGKEIIEIFNNHSIYFFPTFYGEGMPTSLLEAMAFGQIIVTRPVGGIKDFYSSNMGYLSNSLNPKIFEKIVVDCINDKSFREKQIFNFNYSKENFLASKVAVSLEDIFKIFIKD